MRALWDTHAFVWWITDDPRLSPRARAVAADPQATLLLSAASLWELAIKASLGKLRVAEEPEAFLRDQIARNETGVLAVESSHALAVFRLPAIHRDPFDRILVVQASVEGVPILTTDPVIARYDVEVIW